MEPIDLPQFADRNAKMTDQRGMQQAERSPLGRRIGGPRLKSERVGCRRDDARIPKKSGDLLGVLNARRSHLRSHGRILGATLPIEGRIPLEEPRSDDQDVSASDLDTLYGSGIGEIPRGKLDRRARSLRAATGAYNIREIKQDAAPDDPHTSMPFAAPDVCASKGVSP
jgi:hypothetical protein